MILPLRYRGFVRLPRPAPLDLLVNGRPPWKISEYSWSVIACKSPSLSLALALQELSYLPGWLSEALVEVGFVALVLQKHMCISLSGRHAIERWI